MLHDVGNKHSHGGKDNERACRPKACHDAVPKPVSMLGGGSDQQLGGIEALRDVNADSFVGQVEMDAAIKRDAS